MLYGLITIEVLIDHLCTIASIQLYTKKSFVHLFSASITILNNNCISK